MSDLPGPGRVIGKLYSGAGKILERCIYRFAHRCGYGPHAVYERFVAVCGSSDWIESEFSFPRNDRGIAKAAIMWDALLQDVQ